MYNSVKLFLTDNRRRTLCDYCLENKLPFNCYKKMDHAKIAQKYKDDEKLMNDIGVDNYKAILNRPGRRRFEGVSLDASGTALFHCKCIGS